MVSPRACAIADSNRPISIIQATAASDRGRTYLTSPQCMVDLNVTIICCVFWLGICGDLV